MRGRRFFATIGRLVAAKKPVNNPEITEETNGLFSDDRFHVPQAFSTNFFARKNPVEIENPKENVKSGPSFTSSNE